MGITNPRPLPISKLYWYKVVEVISVYDGDTATFKVDLGFKVTAELKIRLARIDAPEKKEVGGPQTTEFVKLWLENSNELYIKTYKDRKGKWGRYVADILNEKGVCLNDVLIAKNLANPY